MKMKVSFSVTITLPQLHIFVVKIWCHVRNSLGFTRYFLHGNLTNFSQAQANRSSMAWKNHIRKIGKCRQLPFTLMGKIRCLFLSKNREMYYFYYCYFNSDILETSINA